MGNVENESGFQKNNKSPDSKKTYSYGLYQCNSSWCPESDIIGKTTAQQSDVIKGTISDSTMQSLKSVPDTPEGAAQAARIWAERVEHHGGGEPETQERIAASQDYYARM